jgi:hypothetical protein
MKLLKSEWQEQENDAVKCVGKRLCITIADGVRGVILVLLCSIDRNQSPPN